MKTLNTATNIIASTLSFVVGSVLLAAILIAYYLGIIYLGQHMVPIFDFITGVECACGDERGIVWLGLLFTLPAAVITITLLFTRWVIFYGIPGIWFYARDRVNTQEKNVS